MEFTAFKYIVFAAIQNAGSPVFTLLQYPPLTHDALTLSKPKRPAACAYACANEISTLPMFCSRALTLLPLSANSKPVHDPVVTN